MTDLKNKNETKSIVVDAGKIPYPGNPEADNFIQTKITELKGRLLVARAIIKAKAEADDRKRKKENDENPVNLAD